MFDATIDGVCIRMAMSLRVMEQFTNRLLADGGRKVSDFEYLNQYGNVIRIYMTGGEQHGPQ